MVGAELPQGARAVMACPRCACDLDFDAAEGRYTCTGCGWSARVPERADRGEAEPEGLLARIGRSLGLR